MADPKLVYYIKRSLDNGIKREEINAILIDAGWKQSFIDDSFKEAGSEKNINPVSGTSTFNKLRHWLLILIGTRLVLIPINYFFAPLLLNQTGAFGDFSYVDYLSANLFLTLVVPLLWILPFWLIWRHKKAGYIVAILFSSVLIYLNIFGVLYILIWGMFGVLSVIYLITGFAIIALSVKSLKYFPKKSEESSESVSINESRVGLTKFVITLILLFVIFIPGILGLGIAGSILGEQYGRNDLMISLIVTLMFGILLGWISSTRLINCVKTSSPWTKVATSIGFFGGALAQIPMYGFEGLAIIFTVIAIPIGGVIGILLSFVGGTPLLYAATKALLGRR